MGEGENQSVAGHPLEPFLAESRIKGIAEVLANRTSSIVGVLDNILNDHNVSAILRSADAFGIQNLYLIGESFAHSRGISLGSERWLDLHHFDTPSTCLAELRRLNFKIATLQAESLSVGSTAICCSIHNLPCNERLALVFGNEKLGVSPELSIAADYNVHIPMVGFVESLNVSVAAALTFCAALNNRRPSITEEEQVALKDRWLRMDLRGGDLIMERLTRTEP